MYAIYKRDKFLDIGTLEELAQKFQLKMSTLKVYMKPSHLKRSKETTYIVIRIEDD